MASIDVFEKEEKLLSHRTRLTRNIFFALSTSREQEAAKMKQGQTNTSELDFVEVPPKHPPRNVYLGRSMERWGAQGASQGPSARSLHDDEVAVQRLKLKLEAAAEESKPLEEKPEEVQKRTTSTLGHPGVSFSRLPRFGTDSYPSNSRPGSASNRNSARTEFGLFLHNKNGSRPSSANNTKSGNTTARGSNDNNNNNNNNTNDTDDENNTNTNNNTGRNSSRSHLYTKTEKELIREAEKENEIEHQRELALHPTRFVKQEIMERKKRVVEMSARPSFGLPPPRPSSGAATAHHHHHHHHHGSPSSARRLRSPSYDENVLDEGNNGNDDHHQHHKEKQKAPPPPTDSTLPWPEDIPRASDFVLPWEVKKKVKVRHHVVDTAALENQHPDLVSDEEERDKAEAEWQAERDRILDSFGLLGNRSIEGAKRKAGAERTTVLVNMAKQVSRDKVVNYHARTKEQHDLLYHPKDDVLRRHRAICDVKMEKYAKRSYNVRPFFHVPDELLKTDHLLATHKGMVDRERNNFIRLLNDATEQELKLLAQEDDNKKKGNNSNSKSKEIDPIKVARAEAAKSFLRQFQPPDSVEVPGLPISAADDARFNDGFTTTTRARPKTSGDSIVTRKFKGAPNLGSYADRPDDHFAAHFKGDYAAARKIAAKEVDAELAAVHQSLQDYPQNRRKNRRIL